MWYVYLYLREDRTPYYVGKGTRNRCHAKNRTCEVPPADRITIVKYFQDEDESYAYEEWLIRLYGIKRTGGILENKTIGRSGSKTLHRTEVELKERRKEVSKKYRQSDKGKKQRENNMENIRARKKRYAKKNREKLREYQREWREKNKEKYNEYQKNLMRKRKGVV
ncbi:hypothetical protein Syn7803US37_292 [Synechococcus phage ACG-2014f]|uniref:GIY-YIG domain-containing protein n=1 Tax=Synechococcus phage ACG-2014f TaxID=1493511 RepID=A0A0E3FPI3_9CAUD|nr:hypothetical protein Syn7803US37_292 [Synechococcus phage ACG-2014f]